MMSSNIRKKAMKIVRCPFCGMEMNYDTSVCQYVGCGASLPENASYCPQCGGEVDEEIQCPRCRSVISEADVEYVETLNENEREERYAQGMLVAEERKREQEEFIRKMEEVGVRREMRKKAAELEYNRSLEERIDKWMDGISVRVKEMDEKCRKMMEALPEIPDSFEGLSQDEEEKVLEEECRRFSLWDRKGLSREDWGAFEREIQSRRLEFWKEYIMMRDSDYDCDYLLGILGFKLKWMVFYWDNFGHCENGGYRSAQMRLAVRLIDIIRAHGLDDTETESLPYVNTRNRDRFDGFRCDDGYYLKGEPQRVRFHKAWCLLWKLLKENLLDWWD